LRRPPPRLRSSSGLGLALCLALNRCLGGGLVVSNALLRPVGEDGLLRRLVAGLRLATRLEFFHSVESAVEQLHFLAGRTELGTQLLGSGEVRRTVRLDDHAIALSAFA